MAETLFSDDLQAWLESGKPKTLASLTEVFAEKSFALLFLMLLILSAAPLPTGGITNIFEIIAMLLALELIIGRRTLWLPSKLKNIRLNILAHKKAVSFIIGRVQTFERFARPRMDSLLRSHWFDPFFGLVVLIFTLGAFFAPPFAGLDTLPSLGVVVVSLGVIFEDMVIFVAGVVIGLAGIAIQLTLGATIIHFISNLF
jgi:hypothetical protein